MISAAKSRFRTATHAVAVVRGSSGRPLFVTAAGMPGADAADLVRRMTGRYRRPDALRRADTPPGQDHPQHHDGRQPDRPTRTRDMRLPDADGHPEGADV